MGKKRRAINTNKYRASRPHLWRLGHKHIEQHNSDMIAKVQEEKKIDSTDEIVEEMIKEVEEMVVQVIENPNPEPVVEKEVAVQLKAEVITEKPKTTKRKPRTRKPRVKKEAAETTTTKPARKKRTYTRRKKNTKVSPESN